MTLEKIEFEEGFIYTEIAPRIDEQGGHVDLLRSLVIRKLSPPWIGEIVPEDVLPIGIGHSDALHHVHHWKRPQQRLECLGSDNRLRPRRKLIGNLAKFIGRQPSRRTPEYFAAA